MPCKAFFVGDPLLDLQIAHEGETLLRKYGLEPNGAIRAEERHEYQDIVREHQVTYVAGGGAQTAARAAAYLLPPSSVGFTGCVGNDAMAEQLRAATTTEGVNAAYLVRDGEQTGVCAVIITDEHRSMVTSLQAASKFDKAHLNSPEVAALIDEAQAIYVEGFFLTHNAPAAVQLGQKAREPGKTFILNLSAPFIAERFKSELDAVLPYVDVVIANESEAKAWAVANDISTHPESSEPARHLASIPRAGANTQDARGRTIVITHSSSPTLLLSSPRSDSSAFEGHLLPVKPLSPSELVDTNAAGDAFAGGFVAAWVSGKSAEECVRVGQRMGAMCCGQVGPAFKWPKVE
ncbi:adenosine kinase, partial [Pterulicium gracile]